MSEENEKLKQTLHDMVIMETGKTGTVIETFYFSEESLFLKMRIVTIYFAVL